MNRVKPFSLLMKPASAACNLRCEYCFYIDHLDYVKEGYKPIMSDTALEKMISSYMKIPLPEYNFGWQGGEPTILGLEFYKKVIELQKQYAPPNAIIGNAIQTNGTLIDQAMAEFFAENNFLLGVSLDGPKDNHNRFRLTESGNPTHEKVMRGIDFLRQAKAEFNILCLVNSDNVQKPKELYKYYKEKGFNFLQFIPCVEYDDKGNLTHYSITGEQWGEFLCDIFDLWYRKDTRGISIRHFDSVLNYLVKGQYTQCTMDRDCRQYFVVEYDGGIFPCDFFVEKELQLGNIEDTSWESALENSVYENFGKKKSQWNSLCDNCEWLELCHGDCQKMRGPDALSDTLSTLCAGWKMFYKHTIDRFETLAQLVREQE
ncbi:MAG: anaerobic sulfatase maturase [Spirochaetia bacterium]|nr:anaerobic sulfatase maturase [Spirochaetia bacterium]